MTPFWRRVRGGAPGAGRHATRLLLALAVCVAGLDAAPSDHIRRSQLGIVVFDLNDRASEKLSELGVGVVRGSCNWNDLEPARGRFTWDCADNVIVGAQAHGWRSYLTVTCTPDWANGGAGCAEMPTDITTWYELVASFVGRYRLYDTILGVWNEPNLSLHDGVDGGGYALLFINASNARNAVAPSFVLAGPDTSHHALASGYFAHAMDRVLAWHAFAPQDIVGVHWYHDGPPLPAYMDAINAIVSPQTVWLSETGFASPDPAAQADFFDSVLTVFASSDRPWWTHLIFYRLWDGLDCCSEAILRADYTPKPAFDSYRGWIMSERDRRTPGPPGKMEGARGARGVPPRYP